LDLFIVVFAILFVQVWGAENPLHKDDWMDTWLAFLEARLGLTSNALFGVVVLIPLALFFLVIYVITMKTYWPILPIGVVTLLYSFGRGEFSEIVAEYTKACYSENWADGIARAQGLGVEVEGIPQDDWPTLHQHVFDEAAYRGFERIFAVLFWFFVLGPVGALAYRLIFVFNGRESGGSEISKRMLWLMEWPAVRVLGLSFALTGNFVGCIQRWRESLLCVKRPTMLTIGASVLGALSVGQDVTQTCEVTRYELSLLDKLYKRTLWFWLAMAALVIIFM